ncbi:MAG: thiamine pyrophosphate-dependent enzyme [Candidatus Marinimicrobia bacterium]|jgi:pyruvate/2-oxoacid:ferredoxin oxidoreductase beta subunit/Pyruvate/2-oxoacid:ferredoxin oxidoreductase delta subunit|nr:thiamine pyrophosphate-binding protein [Candidatus Neomarinimicrobiota bacterium]MDP6456795.1 thiamine pyrophosphate-dependent enzyme [Candidatus Neomarinimicrobiota bacterium]MDP6593866.1 thiamine pyrophosphate-dependent enzyme [Candidatus Neomarinimicrobiota bacterium]MDP6835897.1 thiamine pyrophosphate-dependent enzyme [Candidatus Neomarinimicrobiota bacterium]|tara:strand:- start:3408 stop:4994 length:1587 start_codon:yes stop_codon:yes gene_type:complete
MSEVAVSGKDKINAFDILDIDDFNDRIVGAYNSGIAEDGLPADLSTARSLIPAGTAALRDFSYIAPDIPEFIAENCVACMDCVTQCPDTSILGKAISESQLTDSLNVLESGEVTEWIAEQWAETNKFFKVPAKQGKEPAKFGIFIDPSKCKGCAECVDACGEHDALKMINKVDDTIPRYQEAFEFFESLGPTPSDYINERVLPDMMLASESMLYTGGAGSCMGCGEGTALRMMLAATGFVYGRESIGLVASTGCNTVYGSTYPYNPFLVPWTNSLFENNSADAMGIRTRWNQLGWNDKKLWCIGGDGAMVDIGFQSLSRMLVSGMDINVLILDTQVYSNTGGQASTASFTGQEAKMSIYGSAVYGKTERRKEIANLAMMHPEVFVAQTTAAHTNHFYNAVMAANEYKGPAVVNVYTTCQPEHGVADNLAMHQAKLAADCRAFPVFIHDPRNGVRMSERLSLQGNPAKNEDWYVNPKTSEQFDFIYFAKTEGRFAKHFDKDGNPDESIQMAQEDRLKNWRLLQELAGII